MAYTTLFNAKMVLGIPSADTTQDGLITFFISQSTALINEYLGRDLTQQNYTEYYTGNGYQYLILNQRPITLIQQACTLNGTTSVTVGSSAGMIVGMPVGGTNPTPVNNPTSPAITPGTTVASIVDATHITLSSAANVSGSQTLYFGCQVWVDPMAYWGQAAGAFPNNTALTPGADYAVMLDQPNGTSRSGMLCSINTIWPMPSNYVPGLITPYIGPGVGNIKVCYTAGFATIPSDLSLAANMLIARLNQTAQYGTAMDSESVKDYSYRLGSGASGGIGLITPEIGAILAKYIDVAI